MIRLTPTRSTSCCRPASQPSTSPPPNISLAVVPLPGGRQVTRRDWDEHPDDGSVYPQGSMRLGTITRNIHRNDEIDIDLVALRDGPKTSITPGRPQDGCRHRAGSLR